MNLQKLKSVYDASRALNGHSQEQAAKQVGKSHSMINQVLSGSVTSRPTTDAVIEYCNRSGLNYTIQKLGLDPDSNARNPKSSKDNLQSQPS